MRKLISLLLLFAVIFTLVNCTSESIIEDESSLTEVESQEDRTSIAVSENQIDLRQAGFDEWGFNFRAHKFKGYLINAVLGDPAFEGFSFYRVPGLVYQGEGQQFWNDLVVEHPDIVYFMPGGLLECELEMKWNEAALSSDGVYPPTWNDTGAWFLFKYKMNTPGERWTHVRRFSCINTGDERIDGYWYNSEGEEIGMESYYWADQLIIKQVVNNGNNPWVPAAMPPTYTCPNSGGFGN